MSSTIFALCLTFMLHANGHSPQSGTAMSAAEAPFISAETEGLGVRFTVRIRRQLSVDEPGIAFITLENRGADIAYYAKANVIFEGDFSVTDCDGNTAPLTTYGTEALQRRYGITTHSIHSGESFTIQRAFGNCFDLSPGEWRLSVVYRVFSEDHKQQERLILSNLPFEVVDSPLREDPRTDITFSPVPGRLPAWDEIVGETKRNGTRMIARVRRTYSHREPVVVHMSLRNDRNDDIFHNEANGFREWEFEIVDSKGKRAPLTEDGADLLRQDRHRRARLKPGESFTVRSELDKCFELRPGKWRLSVSHLLAPWHGQDAVRMRIRDLPFEIVE